MAAVDGAASSLLQLCRDSPGGVVASAAANAYPPCATTTISGRDCCAQAKWRTDARGLARGSVCGSAVLFCTCDL